VDGPQLESVLWGEIRNFIATASVPLTADKGGPLLLDHLRIRKVIQGSVDPKSYILGRVAQKGEGLSGHHIADTGDGIPRTMFIGDEASGLDRVSIEKGSEWANRILLIGNPYECANEFRWGVKGKPDGSVVGGDIPRENGVGYYRKVVRIRAEDSPNVRFALAQKAKGIKPTGETLIPGVLSYEKYVLRRKYWDAAKQCAGLDADWFDGVGVKMFPATWLARAKSLAQALRGQKRVAKGIGVDPGEGSANTAFVAVDEFGVIERVTKRTPDTSVIVGELVAFMRKHGCSADRVCIDRGAGKQIADWLRRMGYPVRTVPFGGAVVQEPRVGKVPVSQRRLNKEAQYAYKQRRSQLYGELMELMDPAFGEKVADGVDDDVLRAIAGLAGRSSARSFGFAIPAECDDIHYQLGAIPLTRDDEGRLSLMPKTNPEHPEKSLTGIIGRSPDEADALVLAVHAMLHRSYQAVAGVA